jgi:ABC-type polysaccharide/polyol phosphate export permease
MALTPSFPASVAGLLRLRFLRVLRVYPQRLTYGLVLPGIFIAIIGRDGGQDAVQLAFGGAFLSACFMLMRVPAATLADERIHGAGKLLRSLGNVSAMAYFTVHILCLAALAILPLLVFTLAAFAYAVPASSNWWIPLLLVFAALHGIGMCIARQANALMPLLLATDLIMAALVVFSPVFYPSEYVPSSLRPVIGMLPSTLGAQATVGLWRGDAEAWLPTLYLAAWVAGLLLLGYRRFPLR